MILCCSLLLPESGLHPCYPLHVGLQQPPPHIKVLLAPMSELPECIEEDDDDDNDGDDDGHDDDEGGCTAAQGRPGQASNSDGGSGLAEEEEGGTDVEMQPYPPPPPTAAAAAALGGPSFLPLALRGRRRLGEHPADCVARCDAEAAVAATSGNFHSQQLQSQVSGTLRSTLVPQQVQVQGLATQGSSSSCALCQERIVRDLMPCTACGLAFHVECLAERWIAEASAAAVPASGGGGGMSRRGGGSGSCGGGGGGSGSLPDEGRCPGCHQGHTWLGLLQAIKPTGWGSSAVGRSGRRGAKGRGGGARGRSAAGGSGRGGGRWECSMEQGGGDSAGKHVRLRLFP